MNVLICDKDMLTVLDKFLAGQFMSELTRLIFKLYVEIGEVTSPISS